MVKKIYLNILATLFITVTTFAANQSAMYFRNGGAADKTVLTLQALPDGTNNWSCSIPTTTLGTGTAQWFKLDASGNWTTNYNWGYAGTPAFNTSSTLTCNGANGLITAVTGHTYGFTIKDVAANTASVGFVFDFTGTPATISSASASSATPGNPVTVTATLNTSLATNQTVWIRYAISSSTYATSTIAQMTGSGTSYTATIPGQSVGTVVYYYCFTSGTISGGVTSSNVTQATLNKSTSNSYTVATAQVLSVTPSTLSGFSYFPGSGPSTQSISYSLSGQYLTGYPGNITVTCPTDYEISTNSGSTWSTSALIAYSSATLSATTINVRLKAGLSQANYNNELISNAGGGASTMNVSCSGTVLKYAPPNQPTGFTASNGSPSTSVIHFVWVDDGSGSPTPDGYLIRGSAVGYGSITAPVNGTAVATSGLDMNVAQGTQLANITGLTQGTTYYFNIYSFTNSGTNILYNLVSPLQSSATTSVSTYYSKSTGNLDVLSNWGASTDGSGSAPANFTTDGTTFIIKNNLTPTIGGAWTITGATSKIQVGDGTAAINFTIPSTLTATNMDIMNNATVTLGTAVTLTGTINVNNGGTLNCSTYIVSGTAGVFNLNSGGKLMIGSPLGITTTGTASGNIQTTGTRTYNGGAKFVYNGVAAQVTGNAFPGTLLTGGLLQVSNTSAVVSFSAYCDIATGAAILVDLGATLATGANNYPHVEVGCTVTVNGSVEVDQGGGFYTPGNFNFTYGSNGTFIANQTGQLQIQNNGNCPYWNTVSGYTATPVNVIVKGSGGISIVNAGTLIISGSFQTAGPVAITAPSVLTLNGTCQMNASGSFTNSPTYGASATLIYNEGSSFTAGNEWIAGTAVGLGVPFNIKIQNSTTVNMPTTDRYCLGNLTLSSGTLALNATSGDLHVKGTWTNSGTFTANGRAVWFDGTGAQSITNTAGENFNYLLINKSAGTLTLNNNITINATAGNELQLLNAGGLDLNGNTLTMAGTGGNLYVVGALRTINATGSGTVAITGNKWVTTDGTGTLAFAPTVTVALTAGLDFGAANLSTVNGVLRIDVNGYVANNSPYYTSTSTLIYNTGAGSGAPYSVGTEWNTGTALSTAGVPQNVTVQNSTYITMPTTDRYCLGNLTITNGNLALNATSGDLHIQGNWNDAGSFTASGRAVWFDGSGAQSITNTAGEYFNYLLINKSAGTLTLNNNITVTATVGDELQLLNTGGLDLNGKILYMAGTGGNILASGGTRTINATGSGTIAITANKWINSASAGNLVFASNVTVALSAGLDFGTGNLSTVNGNLRIDFGGYVNNNSPIYGSSSTLIYNTAAGSAAPYSVNLEWVSGNGISTPGVPQNVAIQNSTFVTMPNFDRTCVGNFNIASGCGLSLADCNLTIGGTISGTTSTNFIVTNGAGSLIQTVGNSLVNFPIGLTSNDYSPISFSTSGTPQKYSVKLKSITAPDPGTNGSSGLSRQWFVKESNAGTTAFSGMTVAWNAAFDLGTLPAAGNCDLVGNTTGSNTVYDPLSTYLTISGSDPYSITTNGFNKQPGDITGGIYLSVVQSNAGLPVELSSFISNIDGRNIQLNWETKTEKNSDKFEIERSNEGLNNWESVCSVKAADLSNSPKQYSFTDKNLQSGKYQYRLKMIDNDGTFEFSKAIEAVITLPKNFDLSQNYPNPFNPTTKINYSIPNDSKVTLDIFNISGGKVGQIVNQEQAAGYYTVDFGNSIIHKNLSSGIYIYRISAFDKTTGKGFTSIKKMILLK